MTRKYNPKQTVENILSASAALFAEKGYDKTSMQDIVNALGMSKGAIFHHFKSKEDILDAVMDRQFKRATADVQARFSRMEGLSAKEKLSAMLLQNISDVDRLREFNQIAFNMLESPHLALGMMQGNQRYSAPVLADVLREGIEDGSITTDFPDECAEVFLLLYNFWCDTLLFEADFTKVRNRLLCLQTLMRNIGADIVTDELISATVETVKTLNLEVIKWNRKNK